MTTRRKTKPAAGRTHFSEYSDIRPPKNRSELTALMEILGGTFNFTPQNGVVYSKLIGQINFRLIQSASEVIGGCGLIHAGQYFGGKSVPMLGIAAVGIAPHHRGQQHATTLMQNVLRESRAEGCALSALYPATLPIYRSVGYEQAGTRFDIRIPAKPLLIKPRENATTLRPITAKDEPAVLNLYKNRASAAPGNLDRTAFHWTRIRAPRGHHTNATGVLAINTATKTPEGYAYFLQKESVAPPDAHHAPLNLHVTDFAALTRAAGRRMLSLFADHRSMIDQIIFQGSPDDPLLKLLPERNYAAKLLDHWMLRIVHLPRALEARGYFPTIQTEIHLDVTDDLFPENTGRFTLNLRNGKATVTPGGRGDINIDIRGLAPLYSGHLSPHHLQITGQLSVSPNATNPAELLNILASAFAGSSPWMRDMF